ncbi:MAG: hypothetical protein K2P94_09005 [Rhodospirillaceae bacterium]|nr:hypothetical protein [Rhodospirillaceae bacterium]
MTTFPPEFSDLEPFAAKWAKATEDDRAAARRSATPAELQSFYDAALRRLPEILKRVDAYPLGEIEGKDQPLFHLALSLTEVAPHVEFYKCDPNVPYAFKETRMFGRHAATPD